MKKLFLSYSSFLTVLQIISVHAADRPGLPETPKEYYSGCISGVCPRRAPQVTEIELVESFGLRMTPVKNQGPLGTCATFAPSACVEHYTMRKDKDDGQYYYTPLSEAEFTVYAERHTPGGNCRQGLNLGQALTAATKRGFVYEKDWLPYNEYVKEIQRKGPITEETDICINWKYNEEELEKYGLSGIHVISHIPRTKISSAISRELQRTSLRRQKNGQQPLLTSEGYDSAFIDLIKAYMQEYRTPIAASVATFGSWDNNADIAMPTYDIARQWQQRHPDSKVNSQFFDRRSPNNRVSLAADKEGWHAIVLTGFDDTRKSFKFKNSWGKNWGQYKGYGWLPYTYISQYSSELIATFGS